ncbi:MAG: polyprenyl synthetase family protein [Desulfamplus sp.]|nr:polyprenyl synthetase family protein [Desulfamplus sp.]
MTQPLNQELLKRFNPLTHRELKDKILSKVGIDLANIERALHDNLTPHLDLVSEIAGHLLFSGGKRLRPLLMLLSARLCNYQIEHHNSNLKDNNLNDSLTDSNSWSEDKSANESLLNGDLTVKFSTIFEYLHAATLLHDDVVDEAQMRRGKPAAHSRWSVPKVVLTGDFLLARSLSLAAKTEIPEIISIMAGITEDMSQGEIDQMEQKGRLDLTESQYLKIIKRKTAVLIQGACRSGAIIAHADRINHNAMHKNSDDRNKNGYNGKQKLLGITRDKALEREEALDQYGYHLGIAFQMADDLLDYTGDAASLGKNPGADIREEKLTLPLIHALAKANSEDRAAMENIIKKYSKGSDNLSSCDINDDLVNAQLFNLMLEKINKYQGIEYTELRAKNHVEQAKRCLDQFQACEAKEILLMLADYSISRRI